MSELTGDEYVAHAAIEAYNALPPQVAMREKIAELTAERDEARRFGELAASRYNQLLAERVLRCAFCDAEYPPGTPATQNEQLTAHILICAKHPMRQVEAELGKLRAELLRLRNHDPLGEALNSDDGVYRP